MTAKRSPPPRDSPDWEAYANELGRELVKTGTELKAALEKATQPIRDHAEVEFAKAVARHPELYKQVKRTLRELEKTADEAGKALGFKGKD